MGCGLGFIGCGQVELAVGVLSLWVGVTGFALSGATLTLIEHAPRFVIARKRSLRRLCFYTCLSVHKWGSAAGGLLLAGLLLGRVTRPTPGRVCSQGVCSQWGSAPTGSAPGGSQGPHLGGVSPDPHPGGVSRPTHPHYSYCCRQYASFWNAFLFS